MSIKPKKILFLLFLIFISLVILFFNQASKPDSFVREQYRALKTFKRNHVPIYSEQDLSQKLYERDRNAEALAYKVFEPFLNSENLDLRLELKENLHQQNISDGSNVKVISYKANFLNLVKKEPERGPAYLDFYNNKIIIAQENGLFFSVDRDELISEKEEIFVTKLSSNIHAFTEYYDFFGPGNFGLKDILVHKDKIFVSIINERTKDCFNVSILQAYISDSLEFSQFYNPEECIQLSWHSYEDHVYNNSNNKEFNAHQSGGRIVTLNQNTLIFSTGDFRNRTLSQNLQSGFGKILTIDINSGKSEIISFGLRNTQGLYFSKKYQDLFHTDHGPNGGDEINYNSVLNSKFPKNFGWPISSYGGHYGHSVYIESENGLVLKERRDADIYKEFPLYKSHAEQGFDEPVMYFSPSIGISQVIEYQDPNKLNKNNRKFIFGSMGYPSNKTLKDLSLYFLTLDNDLKIKFLDQFNINGRIRDLIVDDKNNDIFFSDDLNGSIGIIKINK